MALSRNKIYCLGSAALIIVALCIIIPLVINQRSDNSNKNNSTRSTVGGLISSGVAMVSTASLPTFSPSGKPSKLKPMSTPKDDALPDKSGGHPASPSASGLPTNLASSPNQMTPAVSNAPSTLNSDSAKETDPLHTTPEGTQATQESAMSDGVSPSQDGGTSSNVDGPQASSPQLPGMGETPQQTQGPGGEQQSDQQAGDAQRGDGQSSPPVSSSPDREASRSSQPQTSYTPTDGVPATTAV